MGCCLSIRQQPPQSPLPRPSALDEPGDLEQANSSPTDAVLPQDDPNKSRLLNDVGNTFLRRFQQSGELSDLDQAISRHKDAVRLIPDSDPSKPICLNNLANSFKARFERLGEMGDLEQANSIQGKAVDLIPDGHPHKHRLLSNLGNSLLIRFQSLGDLSDLEQAISRHRDAVDLVPEGHPDKPKNLGNLGNSLLIRFRHLGQISDLEQAVVGHRAAVDLTLDGEPDKPNYLNNLGGSLKSRFEHLGELGDLEEAISMLGDAVHLTPNGHPDKPSHLHNLGNFFVARFQHLGRLSDLEKAISRHRDAVDLTSDGHPEKPSYLASLGSSFRARFEHLGELNDIEQAISMHGNAVDLTPVGHPNKYHHLNKIANSFFTRFQRLGELSDLEKAISRHRNAVDLTPDGHPEKPTFLNNLGSSLDTRFNRLGEPSDLEQAVSRYRDAVDLTPDGHPDKPAYLSNLGSSFLARFEHLGELSDLEQAISRCRDAVDLTPDGHPHKPVYLENLAICIGARFKHRRDSSDLEQAISLYSQAACASTGPTTIRFRASQGWTSLARELRHHSLLRAYSVAVGLLPQLAWIGLSLSHRYRELIQGADLVREAAAAALDLGHPETAVEWLEQGRSIVWGELFQLRSSYDELSAVHPDHADKLRQLSAALEDAGAAREKSSSFPSVQTQSTGHDATKSLEQVTDRHRKLAIERDTLLEEIRGLPGFERFLLHKEFSQLRASAHSGPVVILNAAESRCDALIVSASMEGVIHVPLPNVTLGKSVDLQTSLKSLLGRYVVPCDKREGEHLVQEHASEWESILSVLWKCVVKPVLDALSFSTLGNLSRIFWCPTGPFTFLPIHAAGFYDPQYSQPGHKIFDFIISSYVPTLSILSPSPKLGVAYGSDLRFLAVRQPPSDGQFRLPGVDTELEHIRAVIKNSPSAQAILLESSVGTVEEVLALMKEADWVHFACHGIQVTGDPTQSGLCLADRRRLRLSDIIALSRPHGGLAFLSACQTATGDQVLSDEAIHIAAGMLFAGYGGVVGTMWSISDRLAPSVAKDVYEQLFRNGTTPDYRQAARALHDAVGRLRNSGASFTEWLPFIHVGL